MNESFVIVICLLLLVLIYYDLLPFECIMSIYLFNAFYFLINIEYKLPIYNNKQVTGAKEGDMLIYNNKSGRGLRVDNEVLMDAFTGNPDRKINQNLNKINMNVLNSDIYLENTSRLHDVFDVFVHQQNIKNDVRAKYHIWVPNQELISDWDLDFMKHINLVLCKTKETETKIANIYNCLNSKLEKKMIVPKIIYTGFTSKVDNNFNLNDKINAKLQSQSNVVNIIHLGGSSPYKNTHLIVHSWLSHGYINDENLKLTITFNYTEMFLCRIMQMINKTFTDNGIDNISQDTPSPIIYKNMTIYSHYDDIATLRREADIALCLSAGEGYGHYINESLYYGILPLVIDTRPMNEFFRYTDIVGEIDSSKSGENSSSENSSSNEGSNKIVESNIEYEKYLVSENIGIFHRIATFISDLVPNSNCINVDDSAKTPAHVYREDDFKNKLDNLINMVKNKQHVTSSSSNLHDTELHKLQNLFRTKETSFFRNMQNVIKLINSLNFAAMHTVKITKIQEDKNSFGRRNTDKSEFNKNTDKPGFGRRNTDKSEFNKNTDKPGFGRRNTDKPGFDDFLKKRF